MTREYPTYVYFLRGQNDIGDVKIGYSNSPISRCYALSVSEKTKLKVLGSVRGGVSDEARLHQHLRAARTRGEWFCWTPYVAHIVTSIIAGSISVRDLKPTGPDIKCQVRVTSGIQSQKTRQVGRLRLTRGLMPKGSRYAEVESAGSYQAGLKLRDPEYWEDVDAFLADPIKHGKATA